MEGEREDESSMSGSRDEALASAEVSPRGRIARAIKRNQDIALEGLQAQAKRMKVASNSKFPVLEQGTCVTVPIPQVDRSKGDLRNLIGRFYCPRPHLKYPLIITFFNSL